jgi:hypothetical protein
MQFKEGGKDVQDDPRSGQPKTHRPDGQMQMWTEYEPWCAHIEDKVLFGSADKVICSEEKTQTLA